MGGLASPPERANNHGYKLKTVNLGNKSQFPPSAELLVVVVFRSGEGVLGGVVTTRGGGGGGGGGGGS